ncbi:MAG: glycosyltransferase [Betaproteobacteria bacterium]|nr:glycosyltransferase [Betaproteobacteria bacterium]NDD11156.1 glycosyltransferase [Betaproteobacteria bacterium]
MRSWLVGIMRQWALALPLSRSTIMTLATLAFRWFGPLFRGDPAYERYIASNRAPIQELPALILRGSAQDLIAQWREEGFDLRARQAARVTVFVPTFGQFHHTLACLGSLYRCRGEQDFNVLVVDDASGEAEMALLGLLPGVGFVSNTLNLGFLENCNHSLKRIDTEFICLLNNDTEVCPGWLHALIEVMDQHADCGVVGSKLLSSDGRLQEAGGILWRDASAWNWGRGDDPSRSMYNFLRETDYVSGASMLIRSSLWKQLNGFDTRYRPAYCEDADFAFRAREAGMRVIYQPFSLVIHHEGVSHGTDLNQGIKSSQVVNQGRFFERWQATLQNEHFPNGQHVFLARNRSGGKAHILFADHYVPQPDRDAGSRAVFEVLKAISGLGMHLIFWPHNGWYDPDYTPTLQRLGIEVVYGHDASKGLEPWLEQNARYLKAAILSRPDVFDGFEPALRRHRIPSIFYYGHDIHHQRMAMQRQIDPKSHSEAAIERMREREYSIWRRSDRVLYLSEEEAQSVERALAGSAVNAQAIQPYVFEPNLEPAPRNERSFLIFVAGFAHPPNEDAAQWLVEQIMPRLWKRWPDLKLKLVGSNPTQKVKRLAQSGVEVTGYVSDQALGALYNGAILAVVPLRFGAGVKNKVIEALAQGVPLVTTDIGMQGLAEGRDAALIANTSEDFARASLSLINDEVAWYEKQSKGQAYARRFSAQSMKQSWKDLLVAEP